VVALDLDLATPALHYRLSSEPVGSSRGAVPYLLGVLGGQPAELNDHLLEIDLSDEVSGRAHLMPAGPAPDRHYWATLAQLSRVFLPDRCDGEGLAALLDLQTRIEREISPDYLLIDTPSGISEIGGLVTTLLADSVVCVVECDRENAEGSRNVIRGIFAAPRFPGQLPIEVFPILVEQAADQSYDSERVGAIVHSEILHERPELYGNFPEPLVISARSEPAQGSITTEPDSGGRLGVLRSIFQIAPEAKPATARGTPA
jgi:hypothetical protein